MLFHIPQQLKDGITVTCTKRGDGQSKRGETEG